MVWSLLCTWPSNKWFYSVENHCTRVDSEIIPEKHFVHCLMAQACTLLYLEIVWDEWYCALIEPRISLLQCTHTFAMEIYFQGCRITVLSRRRVYPQFPQGIPRGHWLAVSTGNSANAHPPRTYLGPNNKMLSLLQKTFHRLGRRRWSLKIQTERNSKLKI